MIHTRTTCSTLLVRILQAPYALNGLKAYALNGLKVLRCVYVMSHISILSFFFQSSLPNDLSLLSVSVSTFLPPLFLSLFMYLFLALYQFLLFVRVISPFMFFISPFMLFISPFMPLRESKACFSCLFVCHSNTCLTHFCFFALPAAFALSLPHSLTHTLLHTFSLSLFSSLTFSLILIHAHSL